MSDTESNDRTRLHLTRRHLAFGWFALLAFLSLGPVLEGLHAFKIGFYLDSSSEIRRLLWTLAHAHGALLGLVQIAFALSLPHATGLVGGRRVLASRCLLAAALLIPLGFLLGGAFVYEGDPGLPILLVPVGAVLLILGVLLTALGFRRTGAASG